MKTLVGLVMLTALGCGAEMPPCQLGATQSCGGCPVGMSGTETCALVGNRAEFIGCACHPDGPCGARACGREPTSGANCGTCPAPYLCTSAGHCAAN